MFFLGGYYLFIFKTKIENLRGRGHFPSFQVLREASMGVAASDTYLNTILVKVYSIKNTLP